jgi:hypothetical protein
MSHTWTRVVGMSLLLAVGTSAGAPAATRKPLRQDQAIEQQYYGRTPAVIEQEERANERVGPDRSK